MLRWQTVAVAYALLGSLAFALAAVAHHGSPFSHPSPWLALDPAVRWGTSIVAGLVLALVLVSSTRLAVRRWKWAQKLHADLRPVARNLGASTVVAVAVLSGLGEELFFRGFLSVTIGIWLSSIAFGLLHQVRGTGRFGWAGSAFAMGLFLSVLYALTGQLVGCIVAHACVNLVNLQYLRDHDPHPKPRKLGGLLKQS